MSREDHRPRTWFSTAGLAKASARRPWIVVITWIVLLVFAGVAASGLGDAFATDVNFTNNPESVRGDELLTERLREGQDGPVTETLVVRSETSTVDDPAFRAVVERAAIELRAIPEVVEEVITYYGAVAAGGVGADRLISPDRQTALVAVTLVGDVVEASEHASAYLEVIARQGGDGVQVLTVGDVSSFEEFNKLAGEDLVKGEGLGLIAALVILVVVFGALVAAGVPIALAVVSIFVAVGLSAVLGRLMDLSFFIVNMITMIGLAVGIDYALFIVSRYR